MMHILRIIVAIIVLGTLVGYMSYAMSSTPAYAKLAAKSVQYYTVK